MAHHGIYPDINSTFGPNVKYQITAPYHPHQHPPHHQLQTTASPSTTTLINNSNKSFLFDDGNTSMSSASNNNTTAPNFNETSHNSSASTQATKQTAAATTARNPATSENTTDSGGGRGGGDTDTAGKTGETGAGVGFMGRNGAFGDGGNFQKTVSISRKTDTVTGDSITYNINNINTNIVNNINNSSNISHGSDFFGNQHQVNGDTVVNINNGNSVMTAPYFVQQQQQAQAQPAQPTNLDSSSASSRSAAGVKSFGQLYEPQSASGVPDYGDVFDLPLLSQFDSKNAMKHPATKVPPNYYYPQGTDYQGSQHTYGGLPAPCSGYQQQQPKPPSHQETTQKTAYAYDPYHASVGGASAEASSAANYLNSCNRPLYARQQPNIPTNHQVYSSHELLYQNDQRLHGHQSLYPPTSSLAANVYHHKSINPLTTTANSASTYPPPNYNLNGPLIRSSSSIVNPRNGDPNYYMLKPQQPPVGQQPTYANNPYCLQNNASLLSAPPAGTAPPLGNVQPSGPQFPKLNPEIMLDTGGHHHYFNDYQHSNSAYNKTMRAKSFNHIYNGPYYAKHQAPPPNMRPPMGYHSPSGYYPQNPHFHQLGGGGGDAANYMLNPYAKAGAIHAGHPAYPYGGLYKAPGHPQYPSHMQMAANGRPKPMRPSYYDHPHQAAQITSTLTSDKQQQFIDLEEQITGSKILKTREFSNYMPPQYPNYPGNYYYPQQHQKVQQHPPATIDLSENSGLRDFLNNWNDADDEVADTMPSAAVAVPVPVERAMADLPILTTAYDTADNSLKNLQKFSEESIPNNQPGVIVKHSINIPVSANLPDIVVDTEKIARGEEVEPLYNEQLYVLESYEIPISEFNKYKHLSVIEKLPENVVPFSDKEFTGGVENSLKFLEDIDKNWNDNDLEFGEEYEPKDQQRPPTAESSSKENHAVQETVVPAGEKAKVPVIRKYRKRKAQQASFGERSFSDTDINSGKTINPEKMHRHRKWMRTKYDRKNRVLKKAVGQDAALPASPKPVDKTKAPTPPKKTRVPAIPKNLLAIRKPYEARRKLKTQTVVKSLTLLCIDLFNTKSYREYFRANLSPATSKTNSKTLLIQQFKNQLKAKQNDTAKRRQGYRKSVITPLKDMCKEIVQKGNDAADRAFLNDIDKINPEMSFDEPYETDGAVLGRTTSTEEENREFLENINKINPEGNFASEIPEEVVETVTESTKENDSLEESQEPKESEESIVSDAVEELQEPKQVEETIISDTVEELQEEESEESKQVEESTISYDVKESEEPTQVEETIVKDLIEEPMEVLDTDVSDQLSVEESQEPQGVVEPVVSDQGEDCSVTNLVTTEPEPMPVQIDETVAEVKEDESPVEENPVIAPIKITIKTNKILESEVIEKGHESDSGSEVEETPVTKTADTKSDSEDEVASSKHQNSPATKENSSESDSSSSSSSSSSSDDSDTETENTIPTSEPPRKSVGPKLRHSIVPYSTNSSSEESNEATEIVVRPAKPSPVEILPKDETKKSPPRLRLQVDSNSKNWKVMAPIVESSDSSSDESDTAPDAELTHSPSREKIILNFPKSKLIPQYSSSEDSSSESSDSESSDSEEEVVAQPKPDVEPTVDEVDLKPELEMEQEFTNERVDVSDEPPELEDMVPQVFVKQEVQSLKELCVVVLEEMKDILLKAVASTLKVPTSTTFNVVEMNAEEIAQIPLPGEQEPIDEPQKDVIIPVSRVCQPFALKDLCHNFIYTNKQLFEISEAFEVPKLQDLCQAVLSETNIFVDAEKICFFNDEEMFQTDESQQVFYVEDRSGSLADLFNSDDETDQLLLAPTTYDNDDDQTESLTKISEYISEMQREHENSMSLDAAANDCTSVATEVEMMELSDSEVADAIEFQNIQYEEVIPVDDLVYQKERLVARLRHKYINRLHLSQLRRCKLLRKYMIYQRYSRFKDQLVLREQLRGSISKCVTKLVKRYRKNQQPCDNQITEYEKIDDDNQSTTSCNSSSINNEVIETNVINKFSSYDKSCCLDKVNDENNGRRININNNTILEDSTNSYTSSSCLSSSRPSPSSSSGDEGSDSESEAEGSVTPMAVDAAASPGSPQPVLVKGVRGPWSKKKPTFDESLLSIDKYYAKNATNIKNRRRYVPSSPPPGRMRRLIIPQSKIFDARLDCKLKMKPYVKFPACSER